MPPPPQHERQQQEPAPSRRRRRPAPSPYRQAGALDAKPSSVELPDGYKATIEAEPGSYSFLGGQFAMDSLEFLLWMARYFTNDLVGLRVCLHLMGSQQPGGTITATQQEIADALGIARTHANAAIGRLVGVGVVHMPRRGHYQLNPAATLRGGKMEVELASTTGAKKRRKSRVSVDQLDILEALASDPSVPEQFKNLVLPDPPSRSSRGETK
ncbi:hypothetical protein [Streptomyces xiamenensis]|uniref:hypothetical protein n=1 Tax=Streptomyces xiamenensis TaxID=408015 RepID=UPI0035DA78D9